ncbi:Ankyrin-1 [Dactylellina cionopaga]|nr:Ankyrin-1 [Dactylellina cionopaga]
MFSKVYIVVDALDECDDNNNTRSSLIYTLQNLDSRVQLVFTSRPLEDILLDAVQFQVSAQEDDMRKYLRARVKEEHRLVKLCADNEGLEDEILDKIIARVDGMFLLARLHLQSVASKLRVGTLRKALETLPEELNDTYDDAIRRIQKGQEKDRSEVAMKILMLLSFALRPLKLGEIQHALLTTEVEEGDTGIDRSDLYDKELLFTICAGIITLENETSSVRFVHHTAETYFESRRTGLFANAHTELTTVCITYLSFREFDSGFCEEDDKFQARLKLNQLYDYAARNWGNHARDSSTLSPKVTEFLECKAKVEASSQALMLIGQSQEVPRGVTGLHLAAYFGLSSVADKLLEHMHNPDPKDTSGRTPLFLAAQNGHEAIVKLLLNTGGVHPDSYSSRNIDEGRTPLLYATAKGYDAISKMLLNTGKTNPNKKESGQRRRTPLMYAALRGNKDLIELLLERGAETNITDYEGRTALSLAAENGKEGLVKLLAKKTDDINREDELNLEELFFTPPEIIQRGCEAMLLDLQEIFPVNKIRPGRSPLHWAAIQGHVGIAEFLLENGANVSQEDFWGCNALSMAVV